MRERLQDEDGQTAVEYALTLAIAAGSVIAIAAIVGPLAGVVDNVVNTILGAF